MAETPGARPGSGRLGACLGLSVALHALVLAVALRLAPRPTPSLTLIPVALLGAAGGGGGGGGSGGAGAPSSAASPSPTEEKSSPPAPVPRVPAHRRLALRSVPRRLAPPAGAPAPGSASESGGEATQGSGGGSGGGEGAGVGGGEGSGVARVAYGENPPPPYPMIARRLGMEGLVLLEVVVAADGRAEDVRVLRSSGHPPLDESAVATVRSRWRFVPARRDGVPIESRVTVPIRFRLSGAG